VSREPVRLFFDDKIDGIAFNEDVERKFNSGIELGDTGYNITDPLTDQVDYFSGRKAASDSKFVPFKRGKKSKNFDGVHILIEHPGTISNTTRRIIQHNLDREITSVQLINAVGFNKTAGTTHNATVAVGFDPNNELNTKNTTVLLMKVIENSSGNPVRFSLLVR